MRIAVLYPFSNLRQVGWGNSLRVNLLLRYLVEQGAQVAVLTPGARESVESDGPLTYHTFRWPLWPKVGLRLRCWAARMRGGPELEAEVRLRHACHNFKGVPAFWRLARATIQASKVVFLENAFWASAATTLCRESGRRLILTLQDVLSISGGRTPAGRMELRQIEVSAVQQTDYAVCVSPDDLPFWSANRPDVRCVPNPVDVRQCWPQEQPEALAEFRAHHELDVRPICAFVGSAHLPNQRAVQALEILAGSLPEAQFVVAGSCAPRGRGLLNRLGVISESDLRCLYGLAALMVMPVPYGTGTSLKFLEALAYGRAIVATRVAARGYAVESGRHALIEDALPAMVGHVRSILADPERRRILGEQARALSADYDYRVVYQGYRDWLPLPATGAPLN